MARDFNQNRIANARLISKNIDKYGKTYAAEYNADGFNVIDITIGPQPDTIKEYLEGDTSVVVYACASNIDKLCHGALMPFPNIKDLYLFKATSPIVVLDDDLSYLEDLEHIYVPTSALSSYIATYPTLAPLFTSIVEDYVLTIPYIGDSTLTSDYVDSVIAMLSSAQKSAITKVVVPSDFIDDEVGALDFVFEAITPSVATVDLGNEILPLGGVYSISQSGSVLEVE